MKKSFKRAGVAVLSMAMLLSMGAVAATSVSAASTISVVKPSGSEGVAVDYRYFKIADATETSAGSGSWTYSNLNAAFDNLALSNGRITFGGTDLSDIVTHSSDARSLATTLASKVTASTGTAVSGASLDAGYYLIVDAAGNALPVLLSVTSETTDSIVAKLVSLPFNKTITEIDGSTTANISKADEANVAIDGKSGIAQIGDTVKFKIDTEFPTYDTNVVKAGNSFKYQDASTITVAAGDTYKFTKATYIKQGVDTVLKKVGETIDNSAGAEDLVVVVPEVTLTTKTAYTNITDFVIVDVPEDSIVFADANSDSIPDVVVKIDGTDAVAGTDYVIEAYTKTNGDNFTNDGNGFKITFKDKAVIDNMGKSVTVEYTGTLTGDVDVNTDGNNNDAKVTYSNDYYTGGAKFEDDGLTPKVTDLPDSPDTPVTPDEPDNPNDSEDSDVDIFCTMYTVNKTDSRTNAPLTGAVFTIYESDGTTVVGTMTASGGTHTFKGLKPGTYVIRETKVPTGYVAAADTTLEVTTDEKGKTLYLGNAFKFNGSASDEMTIENTPGQTLPGTGGIGTTLFTIGGAAIVLVAGFMFVLYMKKRNAEEE